MDRLYNWQLDTQQMKKIAQEIFEEESQKYGLDDSFFPLTLIEYYSTRVFKGFTLEKIKSLSYPITTDGFRNDKGEIVIFLSRYKKIRRIGKKILELAETVYHELRHSMQESFEKYSYDRFLDICGTIIMNRMPRDYAKKHDLYSVEIGANLYGIRKAKDFLRRKYPSLYEEEKDDIEDKEEMYLENYMLYDAPEAFELAIQCMIGFSFEEEEYPLFDIFLNKEDSSLKKN